MGPKMWASDSELAQHIRVNQSTMPAHKRNKAEEGFNVERRECLSEFLLKAEGNLEFEPISSEEKLNSSDTANPYQENLWEEKFNQEDNVDSSVAIKQEAEETNFSNSDDIFGVCVT